MNREDKTVVVYSIEYERREAWFENESDAIMFFDVLMPKVEQGVCQSVTVFERITRRVIYQRVQS